MSSILLIAILMGVPPLVLLVGAAMIGRSAARPRSWLVPFLHLPAIALWLVLMVAGYGAQSLGNLGEGVILGGMAVAGGYAKVLLVDRHTTKPLATSLALAALLMLGAVALRSFMPLIPE